MKKLLLPLIALFLFSGVMNAQDAATAFKAAKKAYGKVPLAADAEQAAESLATARQNIDIASAGAESLDAKDIYKLWQMKSQIYNDVSKAYINKRLLDNTYKEKLDPNPAMESFSAVKSALGLAEKKWQTKQLMGQLLETANYLANMGNFYYDDKDYKGAFASFEKVLDARNILKENGNTEFLAADEDYHEQVYSVAVCAGLAGEKASAEKYFTQLYDVSYAKPAIYDGLFRSKIETDEAAAIEILSKGRELFPEDEGLLVTEINHYLKVGKLEVLIDKLKAGIEKDPSNVSFITTLGQVYDELGNKELEAGNMAKSDEYNELALNYFQQSLEKDEKNYPALYNIGVIYYNKAAHLTKDLVALESDYSKAGTAKYKAKQEEIFAMFDKALPYFKDAEKIAPDDMGTLIALKEIFAKKNDLATSNEFKSRIEKLNNNEKIEASFFAK